MHSLIHRTLLELKYPAMRHGVQLSAVWLTIQLVSVASAMTKSTCDMVRFNWVTSPDDVIMVTS